MLANRVLSNANRSEASQGSYFDQSSVKKVQMVEPEKPDVGKLHTLKNSFEQLNFID